MNFKIIGGNTKKNSGAKVLLKQGEKYPIPAEIKYAKYAHIYAGKLCFGDLLNISTPKRIKYLADRNKKIIKILETQRGKFVELIPEANSISFPDWDGSVFTRVAFHIGNSTILFRPIALSPAPTPISQRIIPFPQRIIPY
jgi:hypothetical protein